MIKKYLQFIKEVNGTELVGPIGPAYGETRLQNKTITFHDTNIIFSEIDNKFYTIDEYNNLYSEYLKNGGTPLNGFNKENLDTTIVFLNQF